MPESGARRVELTTMTARLPGAGNLLGRAGEDLIGLPDRASSYQVFVLLFFCVLFFFFFLNSIDSFRFQSSARFRVTAAVFVSRFDNHNISFLSIIIPTELSVVACDWIFSAVRPIRS